MLKPCHSELQYTINEKSVLKKLAPIYYLSQKLDTLFLLSLSEMRVGKKPRFYSGSTAHSRAEGRARLTDSSLKLKPHSGTGAPMSSGTRVANDRCHHRPVKWESQREGAPRARRANAA